MARWSSPLAIGIGEGHHTALQKTVSALATPFEEHREPIHRAMAARGESGVAGGQGRRRRQADAGQPQRAAGSRGQNLFRRVCGFGVDSLGAGEGDDDLGGYHLVWTRDMVQTATALLACGRAETARRALVYLACTQQPNGGFAQNFWIDGTPYWSGVQLDEVAFPLILAWRLWKADGLGEMDIFPFVERAAGFLVRHAPITHQERWEENAGLFALHAGGGDCRAHLRGGDCSRPRVAELAAFLEEFADWIERHIEDWTVTNNGVLHPGDRAALHAHSAAGERRGLRL